MIFTYGTFPDNQITQMAKTMHDDVHRLLLYKDENVLDKMFKSDDEFKSYFSNIMFRFGGLNTLLGCPICMVSLLSTLQAAFNVVGSEDYEYQVYRKLILDAHGYIDQVFEGVKRCHD